MYILRTCRNFITYTNSRSMKDKEVKQMKVYIKELKKIQEVNRTWNFSLSTIDAALVKINQDRPMVNLFMGLRGIHVNYTS